MRRVIVGDEAAGWEFFNNHLGGANYHDRKRQQLREFGIPEALIAQWEAGDRATASYGLQMTHVLSMVDPGLERMRPDSALRLGLYAKSIGDLLCGSREDAEIMDFGCGPWVDASLYFASRLTCPTVRLVDINPLPLYFAAWQLQQAGVKHEIVLAAQGDDASLQVTSDTALIIEVTAFEHVAGIRWLFPKMMEALPSGGLFLTNYTRLDWTRPEFDGHQENKNFAPEAVTCALDLAYRYEWKPEQQPHTGWDIWERR